MEEKQDNLIRNRSLRTAKNSASLIDDSTSNKTSPVEHWVLKQIKQSLDCNQIYLPNDDNANIYLLTNYARSNSNERLA